MANREKMIVGLVALFAGLIVNGYGHSVSEFEDAESARNLKEMESMLAKKPELTATVDVNEEGSQTYPYSEPENEVFNEMDELSRNKPEEFEENIDRSGSSEEYECWGLSEAKIIRYNYSLGHGLAIFCINDKDIRKQLQGKSIKDIRNTPNMRLKIKGKEISSQEGLFKLADSTLMFSFIVPSPSEQAGELESCTLLAKSGGVYDVVRYEGRRDDTFWIRYEGVYNKLDDIDKIKQSSGKKVSIEQVQRYMELAERFYDTYSLPRKPIRDIIESGDLEKLKPLVENHPTLLEAYDEEALPLLHLAAQTDQIEIAEFLIEKGADVNAEYKGVQIKEWQKDKGERQYRLWGGYTPLHFATANNYKDIVELLIAKGANVNAKDDDGGTPLHRAVQEDHKDVAEFLIARGADMSARDENGQTSLYWAAYYGHMDIAKLLIDKGADVNAKNARGRTPLHRALTEGHSDIAKLFINKGADVNAKDEDGRTPLHRAVQKDHKDVAEFLIARGADMSARDENGQASLYWAAYYGHMDIAKLLIVKGADVNVKADDGITPLYCAVGYGHEEVAELLRKHGGNMGSEIFDAVVQGEIDKVESLLAQNPELVNFKDSSWKWTPLFWAAVTGHKNIAEFLIDKGADINAKNARGDTPLDIAIKNDHKELTDLLRRHGAVEKDL